MQLLGTSEFVLCYQGGDLCLIGLNDADWDGDGKLYSTSSYIFLLGDEIILLHIKKQLYIAL